MASKTRRTTASLFDNIRELKNRADLVQIIRESSISLVDAGDGKNFYSVDSPGLVVDVERGRYRWPSKGESGDVFTWLENRFGWSFSEAVSFLKNREKLPGGKLSVISGQRELEKVGGESEVQEENQHFGLDWRLNRARLLGYDLPFNVERLSGLTVYELLASKRWIPTLFVPVVGDLGQLEFCSFCLADFPSGWDLGGRSAFIAVGVGEDYSLLSGSRLEDFPNVSDGNGIYCHRCVERLGRWLRAFRLLLDFALERQEIKDLWNLEEKL